MTRIFNYQTYSEIDNLHKDYILSVTNNTDITLVPLPTINNYLTEYNEWLDSCYSNKDNNTL